MTALTLILKASTGQQVTLRAMDWPDGARMDWVRIVDDVPEIVTATLALEWVQRENWESGQAWVEVVVRQDTTTPWEGFSEDKGHATTDDDETRLFEWADSFCERVNKALANTAALTPFADLHWHETEARTCYDAMPKGVRRNANDTVMADGTGVPTEGEDCLRAWVLELFEQAERNARRRAATQFETEGGRLEQEPRSGWEGGALCGLPPLVAAVAGGFCSNPNCRGACPKAPTVV